MTTALRRGDPGRPITIGLHMEDLENDRVIGPAEAARWCDVVSMHGYPIYADWAAGSTDSELVPFLAEVTRWLASGAPVLFEEFGAPTTPAAPPGEGLLDEAAAAEYTGRVLDGLRAVGCRGRVPLVLQRLRLRPLVRPAVRRGAARAQLRPLACGRHGQARGLRGDAPGQAPPASRRAVRATGSTSTPPRSRRTGAITSGASTVASALREPAGSRVAAGKRVGWWDPRAFGTRACGTRIAPGSRPEVARGDATADATAVRT